MREIIVRCGDVIPLGRAGENQALAVLFDVTGWEEIFGSGTFSMAVRRPGEELAYQRDVTLEGDLVRWVVSDVDTGVAGTGEVQLRYSVGETLAKSAVYQTVISPSVGDIGPAPDPYEDFLEEIQGYADAAADSAQAAGDSAQDAEAWAVGERGGQAVQQSDETYHNNAKFYAAQADTAKQSAEYFEGRAAQIQMSVEQIAQDVLLYKGAPLVAATAEAMTDHDRVYVYVGSETGYTAGNWYYWNGSAWTSGGVYNAVAVQTDKTLTVADMAADAKTAGDQIAALGTTSRLGDTATLLTPTWDIGSIRASDGGIVSANTTRIHTRVLRGSCDAFLIHAPVGMKVALYGYVDTVTTSSYVGVIQTLIEPDAAGNVYIPVTKGLAYSVVAGYQDDRDIQAEAGSLIGIYKCSVPTSEAGKAAFTTLLANSATIPGTAFSWEKGSYGTDTGNKVTWDYTIRTADPIPVEPGKKITFSGVPLGAAYVFLYDSEQTFLRRISLADAEITIPDGAAWANLTYGNAQASGITVTDGLDLVKQYAITVRDSTFSDYLDRIGYLGFDVKKGNWTGNGKIHAESTGLSTSKLLNLPVGSIVKVLMPEPGWVYTVFQGTAQNDLKRTDRLVRYSEFEVTGQYIGVTFYEEDGEGGYVDLTVADWSGNVLLFNGGYQTQRETLRHDIPENIGVLNVINRAYQMAKLTYKPVANLPTQVNTTQYPGYVPAGTTVTGVMYSSVRNEGLYVPQCVSLDTYMTALKNPNSYIYTKTEPLPHNNALTYYGAVCSSMVAWCYAIDDVVPTTISFDTYPGMEVIEDQSPYGLKLGDMFNASAYHIAIVTDIVRNSRGVIQSIEVTDQVNVSSHPMTRRRSRTPQQIISEYFQGSHHYVAMRYHYIYKVPYTASPWINLDDEAEEPTWNLNLSPRRGENANWRFGETIEIDVTDAGDFTQARLEERTDGWGEVSISAIPEENLLTYAGLEAGHYRVCLTDGDSDSDYVYFDIIATSESFDTSVPGQVTVAYASEWGTPASISFCNANSRSSDYRAVTSFYVLAGEEIAAGHTTISVQAGDYLAKVEYKTPFGLYSGDLTPVTVT